MSLFNEYTYYDLPLQARPLFSQHSNNSETRPKQLKYDQYRQESKGKENAYPPAKELKIEVSNLNRQLKEVKHQLLHDQHKNNETTTGLEKKKCSANVRSIIQKQLSIQNNNSKVKNSIPQTLSNSRVESKTSLNRYQQLLSQFYGQPKKTSIKKPSNNEGKQGLLQRHCSAKYLKSPGTDSKMLSRQQSEVKLKSRPMAPSGKEITQRTTYLQLYMQKRRPVLFL